MNRKPVGAILKLLNNFLVFSVREYKKRQELSKTSQNEWKTRWSGFGSFEIRFEIFRHVSTRQELKHRWYLTIWDTLVGLA